MESGAILSGDFVPLLKALPWVDCSCSYTCATARRGVGFPKEACEIPKAAEFVNVQVAASGGKWFQVVRVGKRRGGVPMYDRHDPHRQVLPEIGGLS